MQTVQTMHRCGLLCQFENFYYFWQGEKEFTIVEFINIAVLDNRWQLLVIL